MTNVGTPVWNGNQAVCLGHGRDILTLLNSFTNILRCVLCFLGGSEMSGILDRESFCTMPQSLCHPSKATGVVTIYMNILVSWELLMDCVAGSNLITFTKDHLLPG